MCSSAKVAQVMRVQWDREIEKETEKETRVRQCFSITVAVRVYVVLVGLESRADGFIMRKQNDSDNDDQIIIPHLKERGRRCGGECECWIRKRVKWMKRRQQHMYTKRG